MKQKYSHLEGEKVDFSEVVLIVEVYLVIKGTFLNVNSHDVVDIKIKQQRTLRPPFMNTR